MSKTPYEIRLELLKLSNEILSTPVFQKREALMSEYSSRINDETRNSSTFPTLPDFPSVTDVIIQAEELNRFISKS